MKISLDKEEVYLVEDIDFTHFSIVLYIKLYLFQER